MDLAKGTPYRDWREGQGLRQPHPNPIPAESLSEVTALSQDLLVYTVLFSSRFWQSLLMFLQS